MNVRGSARSDEHVRLVVVWKDFPLLLLVVVVFPLLLSFILFLGFRRLVCPPCRLWPQILLL